MNIVITLPSELAHLIYEGTKTIEVRKNFPKLFDPINDVVYVCEKGTGKVTGMFTIDAKGVTNSPNMLWNNYAQSIAIDKKWLMKYAENAEKLYLWHIKNAEQFPEQYPLMSVFGIEKAPQSYAYTAAGWYLDSDFKVRVETNDRKAVQ